MPILVPLVQISTLLQVPLVHLAQVIVIHVQYYLEQLTPRPAHHVKMDIIWSNKQINKSHAHHAVHKELDF